MSKLNLYLSLLFVTLMWGLNVTATKILVTAFSPVTMTSFRIFTASIVALLILRIMGTLKKVSLQHLFYIFIVSLFNVVGHHFFLSIGLTKTTASNGGLILGLSPLVSAIFAIIFLKSKLTVLKAMGIFAAFTGVCFIVLNGSSGLSTISFGDFYIFMAVLTQGVSFILIKKISDQLDPALMTAYMLLFGSVILFVISTLLEPNGLQTMRNGTIGVWAIFFASAIFATGVSHMLYNRAIHQIGVAESAVFINLSPFFSLIGSFFFLGENITHFQVTGFLFIVTGVILGSGALDRKFSIDSRKIVRNESV